MMIYLFVDKMQDYIYSNGTIDASTFVSQAISVSIEFLIRAIVKLVELSL